jgi:hypothetical protein
MQITETTEQGEFSTVKAAGQDFVGARFEHMLGLLSLFTATPSFELARPAKAHLPVIIGPGADGEL